MQLLCPHLLDYLLRRVAFSDHSPPFLNLKSNINTGLLLGGQVRERFSSELVSVRVIQFADPGTGSGSIKAFEIDPGKWIFPTQPLGAGPYRTSLP